MAELALSELLAILQTEVPEREIWAFGSRATGAAKAHSDLDLAVMGDTR